MLFRSGVAAGGGIGLALACDIVVAAESASFVQVFGPQLALVPDVGSTWWVPRLIGPARARGLMMLGDKLPAPTAKEWGLIWECVPDGDLVRLVTIIYRPVEAPGPCRAAHRESARVSRPRVRGH